MAKRKEITTITINNYTPFTNVRIERQQSDKLWWEFHEYTPTKKSTRRLEFVCRDWVWNGLATVRFDGKKTIVEITKNKAA